jgi:type VI secretion system protein ImpH
MAGTPGPSATRLTPLEALRNEPGRFSLFAALRLLEQVFSRQPRLGEARKASSDAIRFGHRPHLTFAPTDVASFVENAAGRAQLEQHSFGMFGPNGPLPAHMTELAYERRRHLGDAAIVDFINVFQHRLITLFYRAWAESDPTTNHERPETDRFPTYVGAVFGLAPAAARGRDNVSDYAKLYRAGLFGQQTRSASALEAILADYFDLPARLREFVGEWVKAPPESFCRLGQEATALGQGAFIGGSFWQSRHKFEIVLGPLSLARFETFLPGGQALSELIALVRLFTNDEWTWQLRLVLATPEIPRIQIGRAGKLGQTTWLGTYRGVADNVVIQERDVSLH